MGIPRIGKDTDVFLKHAHQLPFLSKETGASSPKKVSLCALFKKTQGFQKGTYRKDRDSKKGNTGTILTFS